MTVERHRRREPRERTERPRPDWTPRTQLGREVAGNMITSIDDILKAGRPILETQIVDTLLPDLKEEVLEVTSTQRMTAYGRKQAMRAVVILGNRRGYIAIGVGKAAEARDAIGEAITDAKKHIVKVNLGCGSWECGCGGRHSIIQRAVGKSSSTMYVDAQLASGKTYYYRLASEDIYGVLSSLSQPVSAKVGWPYRLYLPLILARY